MIEGLVGGFIVVVVMLITTSRPFSFPPAEEEAEFYEARMKAEAEKVKRLLDAAIVDSPHGPRG